MDEQKEFLKSVNSSKTDPEEFPDIEIPTLRTYKGDINNTVNKDKITTAKILIAEQKREIASEGKNSETSIKRPTNILVLFLGVILVIASVGLIGYFGYTKIVKQTFTPITISNSFLFIFDQEKLVNVLKSKKEIYSEVENNIQSAATLKEGTYTDIIFYKSSASTKENIRISSAEFFKLYDISLPVNLSRSISQDFVYGLYKTNGRVEPFLVVGLVDYENAYSSMFDWEKTLALDIADLFPVLKNLFDITKKTNILTPQGLSTSTKSIATTTAVATTTNKVASTTVATSTPEEMIQKENETKEAINRTVRFTDVVFSNKDTRAVRDAKGNPFFYYAFINRDKILFAQNPKLVGEISRKINEKSLVR